MTVLGPSSPLNNRVCLIVVENMLNTLAGSLFVRDNFYFHRLHRETIDQHRIAYLSWLVGCHAASAAYCGPAAEHR